MQTIPQLRQEVDQIHQELYALLLRRRDLTMAIWKIKKEQGQPFFSADREAQILKQFVELNGHLEKDPHFESLLSGIMTTILREYEKYLKTQWES